MDPLVQQPQLHHKDTATAMLHSHHLRTHKETECHIFSDASNEAIGAVAYMRLINHEDNVNVSFILGKAKVNPTHAVSIPRLELCAAVLATELAQKITSEIGLNIDNVIYHTDSEIVLGYINNSSKRFHVYVANRVEKIHNISSPHQWRHVSTHENPADIASRSVPAQKLNSTIWLSGPAFLWQRDEQDNHEETEHKYTVSDEDPEVRKQLAVLNTSTKEVEQDDLGAHRFQRFSSWRSLKRSIANLIGKIRQRKLPEKTDKKEEEKSPEELKIEMMAQAETIILRSVQKSVFHKEYEILSATKSAGTDNNRLQKRNPISRMNPFIDEKGLIRVGGRLRQSDIDLCGRHPIILPQDNHISRLIIDHVHRLVQHQGRQLTLSNVRANGYWIMGVHDMVRSILHKCAICRRLRAKPLTQLMADLPSDRTEKTPPFTNVGMDVFGPWTIASRKTRAGKSEAKRWAVIFVCLYTTAVHIEVIDSMDTSSFINALRRFIAIRGNIKKLRCDQGTNFIGAKNELQAAAKELDQDRIKKFLTTRDCEWIFNPPHASHFGGIWERQIGTIRRVLDSTHYQLGKQQYTHDLLTTLMAEASAIVNSRPITTVSSDANDPQALTPNMLLTMKTQSPTPPPGSFVQQDLYSRKRWRRVQYLADQFWIRWRKEYLQNRQPRPKWNKSTINVKEGDVVLLREKEYARNSWPLARIVKVYPSDDNKVRKVDVMIYKDGEHRTYLRPISELVLIESTN
ncbi:uncharacterized protein [Ptychodera flava]|uniref:uncharacterized protein n=1 Tax=Ptychodera flava TaxID=63121 RepID=UPI00396A29F3